MLIVLFVFSLVYGFLFQADGAIGGTVQGVVPIVQGIGAATTTGYLVGFFKKGYPQASDAKIVGVALLAGLISATLIAMISGGIQPTQLGLGTLFLQGISAAALSAGVQGANKPPAPASS